MAQELSGFVNSVKVRMTEEGTMSALTSVMKLCTQSASRKNKVSLCMMLTGHICCNLTIFHAEPFQIKLRR